MAAAEVALSSRATLAAMFRLAQADACLEKRNQRRPQSLHAGQRVAIPAGFEPATHGVEIRYSIQLSYGTVRAVTARASAALSPSSTANMKNPASRQGRRTDFLRFATKAEGGPQPLSPPLTQSQPPAPPPGGATGTFGLPTPCMRPFRKPESLPSVRHLFAPFSTLRG